MEYIDTHVHIWKYTEEEYGWIDENMETLRKDHLVGALNSESEVGKVTSKILVQARQTTQETDFLLEAARVSRDVVGVIGWIDLKSKILETDLEKFRDAPLLKGFRHILQTEPDSNLMLDSEFVDGVKKILKKDYIYEILIYPTQISKALEFLKSVGEGRLMLDHCAKPRIRDGKAFDEEWRRGIIELSKFPNLYCKLSGLLTEAKWNSWNIEMFRPYLETVLEYFGPDRIVWGSDWPVCKLSGSYDDTIRILDNCLQSEIKDNVFYKNAKLFYKLK
ncbi:amidohydrolase family protein [Candidatus Dojkabacteria bacterium]|nr:amidohydrolase family protein [Candidatus Dojkabacteria bacterium]